MVDWLAQMKKSLTPAGESGKSKPADLIGKETIMKEALTLEQKRLYVEVARREFVRLGLKHSFIANESEAALPNPDKPFVFCAVNEETSTRTGADRHNATVLNVSTRQTAHLRFGFGVAVNVPLQSNWFEEDGHGEPSGLKSGCEMFFLITVFRAILEETDPSGLASVQKYLLGVKPAGGTRFATAPPAPVGAGTKR